MTGVPSDERYPSIYGCRSTAVSIGSIITEWWKRGSDKYTGSLLSAIVWFSQVTAIVTCSQPLPQLFGRCSAGGVLFADNRQKTAENGRKRQKTNSPPKKQGLSRMRSHSLFQGGGRAASLSFQIKASALEHRQRQSGARTDLKKHKGGVFPPPLTDRGRPDSSSGFYSS